jgi:putative PIN family toxin of toxin-antitoxin system
VKVVVDSGVVVSGIFWGGKPGRILELWRDDLSHLVTTSDILDEYFRVISELGQAQEDLVSDWTDFISAHALVALKTTQITLCRDSADNKFLECAVSADADCIVSGDDDLLVLKQIHGIPIVKASAFLATYF